MIKKIKSGLNKRKVKIFSLFLLCATTAWFISNLSESYTANTYFNLEYINVPDSLFFADNYKEEVQVKLNAGGFQLMRLNVFRKKIQVDLSQLENKREKYFLRQSVFRKQIEGQLPNSLSLTEVGVLDTLFLDLYKLHTKEVPVVANSKVELKQNYVIEGGLKITPDTIKISGPKAEIDSIVKIEAETYDFENIAANFEAEVALQLPQELSNTKFSANRVVLSGEVYRFSEKILTVSVDVINLPEGVEIRTFPNKVSILCKAKVDVLREVKPSDFSVIADFKDYVDENLPILKLKLAKKPQGVYGVKLKEDTVEFILNRQ